MTLLFTSALGVIFYLLFYIKDLKSLLKAKNNLIQAQGDLLEFHRQRDIRIKSLQTKVGDLKKEIL